MDDRPASSSGEDPGTRGPDPTPDAADAPVPEPDDGPRRLRRSRSDKMLGGVFGGLGPYLGIDPVILRVAWAVLTVLSFGTGVVVYVIAWVVIPEASSIDEDPARGERVNRDAGRLIIGAVFLVLGIALLGREIFGEILDLGAIRRTISGAGDVVGAAILIAIGLVVLLLGIRR